MKAMAVVECRRRWMVDESSTKKRLGCMSAVASDRLMKSGEEESNNGRNEMIANNTQSRR
jgi:hypothetical protein